MPFFTRRGLEARAGRHFGSGMPDSSETFGCTHCFAGDPEACWRSRPDHQLVAEHHVAMDPAYCHITKASLAETQRLRDLLTARGVHSVGRYGGWTYCSIEDNLLETRALATSLARG